MERNEARGTFYAVGVGPGDPELITVKALRVLAACPVIAAPRTKSGEMLALDIARQAADLGGKTILPLHFTMQRDAGVRHEAHLAAARAVQAYLDAGQDVAMLNLGDVSIYATSSYLIELLRAGGYRTVMVPGVPSFCAVAARLGESLTEMDEPLHILPGGAAGQKALAGQLAAAGTKVLMKSGRQLPETLAALRSAGLLEKSAMVRACGLPDEAVYRELEDFPPEASAGYFATVIVKG